MEELELNYLRSLSKQFPTIASASTEIINLQSIMSLPKGTEHFLTDIHGEYEQFNHVLKNGSGSVKRKIDEEFGNTLTARDKRSLATLIYYPKEKLELVMQQEEDQEILEDWFKITLHRLVQVTKRVASKYTRSKVRKALPADFSYVIEELITEKEEVQDKEAYYNEIIHTIIRIGSAPDFIIALCNLIQRLVIDHLHIVGDIYDRGKGPHIILDTLGAYHSVDIQWGNHDVVWMGAASGHAACIANVIRVSARYGNLDTLEEGYGINLIPLATFALETYADTDCSAFSIKYDDNYDRKDLELDMKMHKAIAMIQFKLESQLIKKYPEFEMEDRLLLDKIDFEKGTVNIGGVEYPMRDMDFPTVDPADPCRLTEEEEQVVERLRHAFVHCEKLQRHVRFLFSKGSLYKVYNSNLLYHGCVPVDEKGNFLKVNVFGKEYSGKGLYDVLDHYARKGYYSKNKEEAQKGRDIIWYIWTGPKSPVFGKDKMATFERYFVEDKATHAEKKNSYYSLTDDEETVNRILREFGLDPAVSHIINGHVPVELKKGDTPIKCGGKLLIIDGGFSKAYQSKTGIAGYTLIANSHGMTLVAHEPFESAQAAIRKESDIISDAIIVETAARRIQVADTDVGAELKESIYYLEELLASYMDGTLVEKGV
ncbi:MAG TPA: fructose-1,6-bisphosphatase [Candidatus Eisenbergiella stercorigallinarum]|uniref:Fructose-1,6-bisphosphatase class 3 n=1 Tax=Candidatus Eisenbergiella stercorigallinarum TaxID=2838557 RepID=A0A9D2U0I0_9FIRM|nr:fructose-1,6-bisphosphatase [Candidatus Eisenbergiella stercorigallinarum]